MSELYKNQILGVARSALYSRINEIERELRDVYTECEGQEGNDLPQWAKDKRDRLMKEMGEAYFASSNLWTLRK